MENSIKTTFNTVQNPYLIRTPLALSQKPDTNSENIDSKKKDEDKNRRLIMSLGGLAVLGTACIVGKKLMHGSKKSDLCDCGYDVMEVIPLREHIKNDFKAIRRELIKKINEEAKEDSFPQFVNGRDLYRKIAKFESEKADIVVNAAVLREKNNKTIKEKLAKLSQDPEWKELRLLRKKFSKMYYSAEDGASDEKHIAQSKIIFINDLLINKVYPKEKKAFSDLYLMSEKKVLELVRGNYESYEEFVKAIHAAQKKDKSIHIPVREKNFTHPLPLKLEDIFPDEALSNLECGYEIERIDSELNSHKELY